MNTVEINCSQQALEERRVHRIPHMSDCYNVMSRQELLLLIKGLLDDLQKKDPPLRAKTAKIVHECVVRNRIGQKEYTPLVPVVQRHVKDVIGEDMWNQNVKNVRKARELQMQEMTMLARVDAVPTQVAQV